MEIGTYSKFAGFDENGAPTYDTQDCSHSQSYDANTHTYTLEREDLGPIGQDLYHYHGDAQRIYNNYTITIRYMIDDNSGEPSFVLIKTCKNDENEKLYGALFNVKFEVSGTDKLGNVINGIYDVKEQLQTDENGRIYLTTNYILGQALNSEGLGLSLRGFTGTVKLIYTEKVAPAGHKLNENTTTTITYELSNRVHNKNG